jgi:hypothetical protein
MARMEVNRRTRRQGSSILLHVPGDRLADEIPEFGFSHIRTAISCQLSAVRVADVHAIDDSYNRCVDRRPPLAKCFARSPAFEHN